MAKKPETNTWLRLFFSCIFNILLPIVVFFFLFSALVEARTLEHKVDVLHGWILCMVIGIMVISWRMKDTRDIAERMDERLARIESKYLKDGDSHDKKDNPFN